MLKGCNSIFTLIIQNFPIDTRSEKLVSVVFLNERILRKVMVCRELLRFLSVKQVQPAQAKKFVYITDSTFQDEF
ncbi:hypothetical protein NIES2111_49110 [Nostoc sp. NIES-2111]|nr:hypothetical protein NIES2111_49110 [Nostoc sp. NIES-2111]